MEKRQRYRKKEGQFVTAVRLDLDFDGFTYSKWGAEQRCRPGDWLVSNQGDTYTIDADVFANTYRELSPGVHIKATPIWAEVATEPGRIETVEGASHYEAGDYLVSNNEDGSDAYCISAEQFGEMYELDD